MPNEQHPIVIVGGGLAGLAAAAITARAGHPTVLLEKASHLGGRGTTQVKQGFHLNIGPHALYRRGPAERVLRDLGIALAGGTPPVSGGYAVAGGRLHALPGGALSLLTTSLLGAGAKLEVARLLGGLAKLDASALDGITVDAWLTRTLRHEPVRALLRGLFRLSTYANTPSRMSAGVAVRQLQGALASGVRYLDGGWQTMVDGLRGVAEAHGAQIIASAPVATIAHTPSGIDVTTAAGVTHRASAVVVTADPAATLGMLGSAAAPAFATFTREAVPIHAACLEVALSRLPRPRATFALGVDRPLYLSVHSIAARLAPSEQAMVHVAMYLDPDAPEASPAIERELEGLLDLVQRGWRDVLVHRRFLPHVTVVNATPTAAIGGLAGRPAEDASGVDGVFLAGDWVGAEGHLVDASLASAARAADLALARTGARRAAA